MKEGRSAACSFQRKFPWESSHSIYSMDGFWTRHLCSAHQLVKQHPNPAKKSKMWNRFRCFRCLLFLFYSLNRLMTRTVCTGTYIVDAFKCGNHGTDTSCALNTSINSSISHLSYHLKTKNQKIRAKPIALHEPFPTNIIYLLTNLVDRLVMIFWIYKLGHTKLLGCWRKQQKWTSEISCWLAY